MHHASSLARNHTPWNAENIPPSRNQRWVEPGGKASFFAELRGEPVSASVERVRADIELELDSSPAECNDASPPHSDMMSDFLDDSEPPHEQEEDELPRGEPFQRPQTDPGFVFERKRQADIPRAFSTEIEDCSDAERREDADAVDQEDATLEHSAMSQDVAGIAELDELAELVASSAAADVDAEFLVQCRQMVKRVYEAEEKMAEQVRALQGDNRRLRADAANLQDALAAAEQEEMTKQSFLSPNLRLNQSMELPDETVQAIHDLREESQLLRAKLEDAEARAAAATTAAKQHEEALVELEVRGPWIDQERKDFSQRAARAEAEAEELRLQLERQRAGAVAKLSSLEKERDEAVSGMREELKQRELEALRLTEQSARQRVLVEKQDRELGEAEDAIRELNDAVGRLTVELQQVKAAGKEYEACQETLALARQQGLELAQARARMASMESENASLRSQAENLVKQLSEVQDKVQKEQAQLEETERMCRDGARLQHAVVKERDALRDEVARLTESLKRAKELCDRRQQNGPAREEFENMKALNTALRRDCHRLQKLVRSKEKALQGQAAEMEERQQQLTRRLRMQFEDSLREHRGATEAKMADLKSQLRESEKHDSRMKELMQAELASLRIWAQEIGKSDETRRCEARVADEIRRASKWSLNPAQGAHVSTVSGSHSYREGKALHRRPYGSAAVILRPPRRASAGDAWRGARSCSLPPRPRRISARDLARPGYRQVPDGGCGHMKPQVVASERKSSFAVAEEERIHAAFRDQRGRARKESDDWSGRSLQSSLLEKAALSGGPPRTTQRTEAAGVEKQPLADMDTWPVIEALLRLHNQRE